MFKIKRIEHRRQGLPEPDEPVKAEPLYDLIDVPNDQLSPEQLKEKRKQLFIKVL